MIEVEDRVIEVDKEVDAPAIEVLHEEEALEGLVNRVIKDLLDQIWDRVAHQVVKDPDMMLELMVLDNLSEYIGVK